MKLVVLGDEMFCTAFKLAGIEDVRSPKDAEEDILKLIDESEVGVVIIQEEVLESLHPRIHKTLDRVSKPMFIPLSLKGKEAGESLDSLVKKALGVELK